MFLDQKLSLIRDDKTRLGICCDLRRQLVRIEFRGMMSGALRTVSNVALGLAVMQQLVELLRDRKESRK